MKKLVKRILKRKKKCDHSQNFRLKKHFSKDGAPIIEFDCHDCGHKNAGHVKCNSHDWDTQLIVKKNGIVVVNETGDAVDKK
jgi:hypothetical protein